MSEVAAGAAALADHVLDLEIRIAYQDRTIAALDDVVRSFTQRVEQLEYALTTLRASVAGPAAGPGPGPADDPPPHY